MKNHANISCLVFIRKKQTNRKKSQERKKEKEQSNNIMYTNILYLFYKNIVIFVFVDFQH